jgi:hypothetical protein
VESTDDGRIEGREEDDVFLESDGSDGGEKSVSGPPRLITKVEEPAPSVGLQP